MIFRSPFFLPWLYPELTWKIPTRGKEIYLTFDDGPMPGPTDFVLAELQKVNAKATFFCIGDNVGKHPDLFRSVLEMGHAIGNHTFHHIKGWSSDDAHYLEDIRLCRKQLARTNNLFPAGESAGNDNVGLQLFRPPYGRIKRSQIKLLAGYKIVMWDVLTHDYDKTISARRSLHGSIRSTRPGSIIVFHDSLKAEKKLKQILPQFLDHFTGLGYSFNAIPNS